MAKVFLCSFQGVAVCLSGCCYGYQGVANMLLRLPWCCYGWHGVAMVARMLLWLAGCCCYVWNDVAMCLPGCNYGCQVLL